MTLKCAILCECVNTHNFSFDIIWSIEYIVTPYQNTLCRVHRYRKPRPNNDDSENNCVPRDVITRSLANQDDGNDEDADDDRENDDNNSFIRLPILIQKHNIEAVSKRKRTI